MGRLYSPRPPEWEAQSVELAGAGQMARLAEGRGSACAQISTDCKGPGPLYARISWETAGAVVFPRIPLNVSPLLPLMGDHWTLDVFHERTDGTMSGRVSVVIEEFRPGSISGTLRGFPCVIRGGEFIPPGYNGMQTISASVINGISFSAGSNVTINQNTSFFSFVESGEVRVTY